MRTNERVKEIIVKWYKALPFKKEYDAEFYRALDEIYIDEAWRVSDYDKKCENGKQNLLAYLYFLEEMKHSYDEKGIDEKIFFDGAMDIVRWCDTWSELRGELYLGELNWLTRSLTLTLFTLGRLQFCFGEASHNIEKYGIQKGDNVLTVHIPAMGPLLLEDAKKSIDMAREFFPRYLPETEFKYFTCHSWLLDPTHSEIMKQSSNILAFQSMFDIVEKDEDTSIFGYVLRWKIKPEEIKDAVCKSSFAKVVREKALAGRKFYAGLGIIKK